MAEIKFDAIESIATINGHDYPMYCGFLSASILSEIAEVPSFDKNKDHHQIASDIESPPVDQWQRPLSEKKANDIKSIYNQIIKDNLMANPVLIGIALSKIDQNVKVEIQEKRVNNSGVVFSIPNIFEIKIKYHDNKKPLWILDGQHRIEGLKRSVQKDIKIPFVLLCDHEKYSGPFLAEIFTNVTTKATPMEEIHSNWMQYSFNLGDYKYASFQNAMKTVISLCKEIQLVGINNPFHNRIQFNPYLPKPGYKAFDFTSIEWTRLIVNNYHSNVGKLTPKDLSCEILKGIKVLERLDTHRSNSSKLFSDNHPHKILAHGLICGMLKNIAAEGKRSEQEWEDFYRDPERQFDRCDWSLPFVRSTGALSSGFGAPSKSIAEDCFIAAFNDPIKLKGNKITDFLNGSGTEIMITAYQKTPSGGISKINPLSTTRTVGSLFAVDLNAGGIKREILRLSTVTPNCHVIDITDEFNPNIKYRDLLKNKGLDCSSFRNGYVMKIQTMNYSGDTLNVTNLRIDK